MAKFNWIEYGKAAAWIVLVVGGIIWFLWPATSPDHLRFERQLEYYTDQLSQRCVAVGEYLAAHPPDSLDDEGVRQWLRRNHRRLRSRTVDGPQASLGDTLASVSPSTYWREYCVTEKMAAKVRATDSGE